MKPIQDMTSSEVVRSILALQAIQRKNSPYSTKWKLASKYLNECFATLDSRNYQPTKEEHQLLTA
jgi:hypothetical protein